MNRLDWTYQSLLADLIDIGTDKNDRTGTGTVSLFGYQIRHSMNEGFPLLTTKRMYWKGIVTELLWFLRGDTNIKFLHDNDCHIWDGDYKRSKRDDGELGPIYGKQWRDWGGWYSENHGNSNGIRGRHFNGIDQIANLISELKSNPDSRRLMVSAWNVGELDKMTLPPCHYGFQCYVRDDKYLSLMWNQRSADAFLGLPFNIASYGLLLTLIAKEVEMIPDELVGNLGDAHLYINHINPAKKLIKRKPYILPRVEVTKGIDASFEDITLLDYESHPTIKAKLAI